MNWFLRNLVNKVVEAFAGSGVSVDDNAQLCLPDGLCPARVHRFIEVVTDERFENPRDAMSALFQRIGISSRAVGLLDEIIDSSGGVELAAAARHSASLVAALPEFARIPVRFRDFLVDDLALASPRSEDLQQAVASARLAAAAHVGCAASWDDILENAGALGDLARDWREAVAAA